MNWMLVFVVNFHPQFVTKVDKAYNVRCFYAQSDKTVTSQLEVRCATIHRTVGQFIREIMQHAEYRGT